MTISVWLDPGADSEQPTRPALKADLAIIGGGVVGASLAYLAAARQLKVVLLDGAQVASGASGRNGGFVLRGIQSYYQSCVKQYGREVARYIYAMGERNQQLIKEALGDQLEAIDYAPCGSYLLASSLEELEEQSLSCTLMREDGFAVDLLTSDPLDRGYYGALFNKGDFGVNPVKLVRALLAKSGAQILQEQSVRQIECTGQGISITAGSEKVICEKVIIATNAYSSALDSYFLGRLQPARGQMFATAPLKKIILKALCYANYGWEYFRQLPDRRLILGGCRQPFLEEECGAADLITKPVQTALEHYLKDHFPELAGLAIEYRWSGTMAFTGDGLPLIGELPHLPGVHFAVGCNGHGLGYSLGLAERTLASAFDGEAVGCFDANRSSLSIAVPQREHSMLPGQLQKLGLQKLVLLPAWHRGHA